MSRLTVPGLIVIAVVIGAGTAYLWKARPDPSQATLLVTVVMCGITAVYALLTLGILRENERMARASSESTTVMERTLRFSYAPHLLYTTLTTRDVKLSDRQGYVPVNNEDYRLAVRQSIDDQQQAEFVFAIVQNVGRASATNLTIDAQYTIWDSSTPNNHYTVRKTAASQILEPNKALALCIFVSRIPTADDRVEIISAAVTTSDFYLDTLHQPPQQMTIERNTHITNSDPGCVIRTA